MSGIVLLDTNICIHAMRSHRKVLERMHAAGPDGLVLNTVVLAELLQGVEASDAAWRSGNARALTSFVDAFEVHPWCAAAAAAFARLRPGFKRAGTMIGELDLMIGAQALARDWTVATENTREFGRIPGLKIENWAA